MKKRIFRMVGLCSVLLLSLLSFNVFAAPPAAVVKPKVSGNVSPQSLQAVDFPVIQYFNVQPKAVQGDPLNFSWNVTPGPGGSQITQVKVTLNNTNVVIQKPGQPQAQSQSIPANWPGNLTFTLTASNTAGKTATMNRAVQVFTLNQIMNNIKIYNMEANPLIFQPNQAIDFRLVLMNSNQLPINGLNIFVMQGSRVVANLTNQPLNSTAPTFMLKDSGYQATGGNYTVDVEYKGQHLNKVFKIKSIPSYTIDPL